LSILFSALLAAVKLDAPKWMLVGVFAMLCLCFLLFIVAYIYFCITNPDALRSEKFALTKMAIERGISGDNLAGITGAIETHKQVPSGVVLSTNPELTQ
jgi:hypothetical protein